MSGAIASKFLLIFRMIQLDEYLFIFAVTSFAPDDVCAGLSAQIRVFQTMSPAVWPARWERDSDSEDSADSIDTTPNCLYDAAIENYNKTPLLPRISWRGNVYPAHLDKTELALLPGCLKLPASVIHQLRDHHKDGTRLCEVLIDLEVSENVLNQQDNCAIEDIPKVSDCSLYFFRFSK
jgi:hypothetical protein